MAVCNLFKKLSNNTGEFLLFSQYTEDLTRNNAQGYNYRVTPSKFIAAEIDFLTSKLDKENLNTSFPEYLQNYFENGCSICRENSTITWDPTISSNLFWNAMINAGLINVEDTGKDDIKHIIKEFRWIGDINIQSYDVKNGMGYSEMYCYIPNTASKTRYGCSDFKNTSPITSLNDVIEGYVAEDFNDNRLLSGIITDEHKYYPNKGIEFYFDKQAYGLESLEDDKFSFNTIIVLYDVKYINESGESKTIYSNIPLGIYLPGSFNEEGLINNSITKWVHNSDIFDSGTSYGVRICSRFSATPNGDTIKTTEVKQVNASEYISLCQVMGGIKDNLSSMMDVVQDSVFKSQSLKDTLAIFKNSRTNVPYPVELGGLNYWFINGRNTGIVIPDGTPYTAYAEDDIKNALIMWDGVDVVLKLYLYTINKLGEKSYYEKMYPYGEQEPTEILMKWELVNKYTLESISPDKLVVYHPDGRIEDLNPLVNIFNIKNVVNDGRYEIKAIWNSIVGEQVTENEINGYLDFKFCLPMYFGLVSGSINEDNSVDSTDDLISNILDGTLELKDVNGLNKYILPSPYNRISFKSNGGRIMYIYPKEYGKLEKIINKNSMDDSLYDFMGDDKEPAIIKVNFPKTNEMVDYYVYYTTDNTGIDVDTIFEFTKTDRQIDNAINY